MTNITAVEAAALLKIESASASRFLTCLVDLGLAELRGTRPTGRGKRPNVYSFDARIGAKLNMIGQKLFESTR